MIAVYDLPWRSGKIPAQFKAGRVRETDQTLPMLQIVQPVAKAPVQALAPAVDPSLDGFGVGPEEIGGCQHFCDLPHPKECSQPAGGV